jgi:hypothetical protein
MRWICSLLLLASVSSWASIGSVTELKGANASVKRGSATSQITKQSGIESNDLVVVGSATEAGLTFQDNTRVKITANSRLVIDDFVFDPKASDAGKLAMKVALGTVKYTSGQIAKTNRQAVNLKTPTATIAVRGTDFSMTVDEAGRSVVVLLPSCEDPRNTNNYRIADNCTVGQIDVETAAGMVSLNQAFTATYVASADAAPLPPVAVIPDIALINNDMNLVKPDGIDEQLKEKDREREKAREDEDKKSARDQQTKSDESSTELLVNATTENKSNEPSKDDDCYPFNECGNEKGRNYYWRHDPEKGNTISVRSGELQDNVTYSISINDNDLHTRVTGDGSTKITIRQWNR